MYVYLTRSRTLYFESVELFVVQMQYNVIGIHSIYGILVYYTIYSKNSE